MFAQMPGFMLETICFAKYAEHICLRRCSGVDP